MTTNVLSHRTIMQIGKYADLDVRDIPPATVISLLRQMLRLRRIEEALVAEYHPADEMRCPVHFCIGQESAPAALSLLIRPDDYVFSHHRSHGYYFARQAPMEELFAEIYGKSTGASGGRAGSQDISHSDSHFYSGAILAGAVSIAAGAAFGLMTKGTDAVAVSGFGEAATDEGAFWEVLNYAGYKKLPLLLVCENNRYSTYSDQLKRHASDNISERARAFGVRATQVFGNDVAEMYRPRPRRGVHPPLGLARRPRG
jgi:TPP-dependent pyruvate/acetoin dehydrogenase alpha subunit